MGFEDEKNLECVRQSKILGLVITDDLKWYQNTKYITERALSKIWTIRRLKNLGLTNDFIFDVYTKEIRSILEFGAPVWTGGLMDADSEKIEKIQKKVFKILLSTNYIDYESACKTLQADTLKDGREKICINLSNKEVKKANQIFTKYTIKKNTRNSNKKLVEEYQCKTDRFYRSGVPYLSRLLNKKQSKK